jgi:hypothetical protein
MKKILMAVMVLAAASLAMAQYYQNESIDYSAGQGKAGMAIATYSVEKDGGAVGDIDMDVTIPSNAIIKSVVIDVIEEVLPDTSNVSSNALTLVTCGDLMPLHSDVFGTRGVKVRNTYVGGVTNIQKIVNDADIQFTRVGDAATSGVFRVWVEWLQSWPGR